MPGGGISMLLRLSPSLRTIGFYLPEPFKADRLEAGYTKLRGCITDDRKPAPGVYPVGGRVSENREKHPKGRKIASTFF